MHHLFRLDPAEIAFLAGAAVLGIWGTDWLHRQWENWRHRRIVRRRLRELMEWRERGV